MRIYNRTIDCTFVYLRQMQLYLDVDSTDNMALWILGGSMKQNLDIFNTATSSDSLCPAPWAHHTAQKPLH